MQVETERFGTIEVAPEALIEVVDGIYGFEQARRFCLIAHNAASPFRWLQCVEAPGLAFVVVNPYDFFTDYEVLLEEQDAQAIGLEAAADAAILSLVTLGRDPAEATANLVGPIVVNAKNRKAKQVVLANQAYTTKHRLLPQLSQQREAARVGEGACSSLPAAAERA